jgi:hypothetical protein
MAIRFPKAKRHVINLAARFEGAEPLLLRPFDSRFLFAPLS